MIRAPKLPFVSLTILLFGLLDCLPRKKSDKPAVSQPPFFTLLPPEQTGVSFQNALSEGLNTNILVYEYFYNGGGVATGDLNGGGLIDLYFTSNMGKNKLYLNKGKDNSDSLRFQDITETASAGGRTGL